MSSAADWNHPAWGKLWLYNLHYFDDLSARGAAERRAWQRALIERWIEENPPPLGHGWEPYPLSLRIVNWVKWAQAGNTLEEAWRHSLAVQVDYLARRLEWHLLGNHLFANAKALIFAGLFFSGPEAERWLQQGLRILRRELPEQLLADGGHFERSPMYHSVILEDLLDLINLARIYPLALPDPQLIQTWQAAAQHLRSWLKAMCHPDGEIALFNDAAFEIACSPRELDAYARRLGLDDVREGKGCIEALSASGYIRLKCGPAVALLDVGAIGPDHLPGHAHADTLSFELSLYGQRVLVNSGTSCYGNTPERLRQRGTVAHTTVTVDGQDSSEVWGGFRVARRARPLGLKLDNLSETLRVECGHDGYRRLPGKPVHWRSWELGERALLIHDHIDGAFKEAVARFYLHPAVTVCDYDEDRQSGHIRLSGGEVIHWKIERGKGHFEPSTYHPRFGVSEHNSCLTIGVTQSQTKVIFSW